MAALWPLSRTKEYDINGDPIVGAKASFYNVGTTTPQTVYADASLSIAYSATNPVLTDGYGRWPAVYLSSDPGAYRQRVVDADDVLLFDDDSIDVPLAGEPSVPDAGDTSTTLLYQTGDLKVRYGTGAIAGYVRCNGASIGSASSGASERANADCELLFKHLWDADPNLAVNGGRGANAAADWAANKRIDVPDMRDRTLVGLGNMGNSDIGLIPDGIVDGGKTNTTLGAKVGAATVALDLTTMPNHHHSAGPLSGSTNSTGSHTHKLKVTDPGFATIGTHASGSTVASPDADATTESSGSHSHTVDIAAFGTSFEGGGAAHLNMQPSMFVTFFLKL